MIVAHPGKVREFARLEVERVFFLPLAFDHDLQTEHAIDRCQTINTPVLRLLHAGFEAQWFEEAVAKTDIGQP